MGQAKRISIVTGAASGIGFACARRFASDGGQVMLADVNAPALDAAVARLRGEGFDVAGHVVDVTNRVDMEALVDVTVERFGRLDIMLNNAGIVLPQDLLAITEDDFDRVIAVNLKGVLFGVQVAAGRMIAQGRGGAIINISSVASRLASPQLASYGMSKAGVNQLTASAAIALAPHGIRVAAVAPGAVATDMLASNPLDKAATDRMIAGRTPIGRAADPAEIAGAVAFLVSDDASYIAGQTIFVDGGRTVLNFTMNIDSK